MSYRLIKTGTGEIVSQYTELPKLVEAKSPKFRINSPSIGVLNNTYSLLEEITVDNGGDVFVDETYQTTETEFITTKNYRAFTQEEIDQLKTDSLEKDIKQVKQYAHNDILNDYEDWKQRNMIASAIDTLVVLLVEKGVITQEAVDSTSLFELKGILAKINERRTLSDQQEQDLINGVKTIDDIYSELYSGQPI